MSRQFLMAIDQGTTGSTVLVVDVTDPQNGSGRMIVRVLIADKRIYTLIVKMGKNGENPEMAEKFFKSFVLTPKTPPKPPLKGPGLE